MEVAETAEVIGAAVAVAVVAAEAETAEVIGAVAAAVVGTITVVAVIRRL